MLFLKVELGQRMEAAGEYHRTSLGRILQQSCPKMKWTILMFNELFFFGNVEAEPGGPPVRDVVEIKRKVTR